MPTAEEQRECLEMNGGGVHGLGAGQIRRCELQMCLIWALAERNMGFEQERVLDLRTNAEYYQSWIRSDPPKEFGFSATHFKAFEALRNGGGVADALREAKKHNRHSTTNESLLRLLPLAVWTSSVKNPYQVKKAIAAEAAFIHQSKLVHSAIFIYVMALQCLLRNPLDEQRGARAYDFAYELSKQELARGAQPGDSAREWLEQAYQMANASDRDEVAVTYLAQTYSCMERPEELKHAFILAFYFLLKSKPGKSLDSLFLKYLK